MDNKTKILIYTGINDSSIEFDLYREVKLETQVIISVIFFKKKIKY